MLNIFITLDRPICKLKTYFLAYFFLSFSFSTGLRFSVFVICSQVSDLISKIQAAYVETLEELSWMDTPSKEKAREKV